MPSENVQRQIYGNQAGKKRNGTFLTRSLSRSTNTPLQIPAHARIICVSLRVNRCVAVYTCVAVYRCVAVYMCRGVSVRRQCPLRLASALQGRQQAVSSQSVCNEALCVYLCVYISVSLYIGVWLCICVGERVSGAGAL